VPGPRSAAAEAVLEEVRDGAVYASHAYLPFGLPGIATIAYEIHEQMGRPSTGAVIAPAGHGGLLLGVLRGYEALLKAGQIEKLPYFVGVQAVQCSPMAAAFTDGLQAIETAAEGPTIAEGVRVRRPSRAEAILNFLQKQYPGSGRVIGIPEEVILPAYAQMARAGVHVEPTSALAWAALERLVGKVPEPIILILSGAGLKYKPA
jgi:threonine synthase